MDFFLEEAGAYVNAKVIDIFFRLWRNCFDKLFKVLEARFFVHFSEHLLFFFADFCSIVLGLILTFIIEGFYLYNEGFVPVIINDPRSFKGVKL